MLETIFPSRHFLKSSGMPFSPVITGKEIGPMLVFSVVNKNLMESLCKQGSRKEIKRTLVVTFFCGRMKGFWGVKYACSRLKY